MLTLTDAINVQIWLKYLKASPSSYPVYTWRVVSLRIKHPGLEADSPLPSRMKPYLCPPIHLHGMVLNYV
jgi:hypothetical protein